MSQSDNFLRRIVLGKNRAQFDHAISGAHAAPVRTAPINDGVAQLAADRYDPRVRQVAVRRAENWGKTFPHCSCRRTRSPRRLASSGGQLPTAYGYRSGPQKRGPCPGLSGRGHVSPEGLL